jgi:hypothetical protein
MIFGKANAGSIFPPAVCRQRSAASGLPPAVCRQRSAASGLPRATFAHAPARLAERGLEFFRLPRDPRDAAC